VVASLGEGKNDCSRIGETLFRTLRSCTSRPFGSWEKRGLFKEEKRGGSALTQGIVALLCEARS